MSDFERKEESYPQRFAHADLFKARLKYIHLDVPVDKSGSVTSDDAWHTLDLTADTSGNAVAVLLAIHISENVADGASFDLRCFTRRNGSAATFEGIVRTELTNNSGGAHTYSIGGNIIQYLDTGQVLEYKIYGTDQDFIVVGYFECEEPGG